jgi:hypothetical protein
MALITRLESAGEVQGDPNEKTLPALGGNADRAYARRPANPGPTTDTLGNLSLKRVDRKFFFSSKDAVHKVALCGARRAQEAG